MKNKVKLFNISISFIFWEIIFEFVFFLISNFIFAIFKESTNLFIGIIAIFTKVFGLFLTIKFALWNTFKKKYIDKNDEKKLLIIIISSFFILTIYNIIKNFTIVNIIVNIISLLPLILVNKYIKEYNK